MAVVPSPIGGANCTTGNCDAVTLTFMAFLSHYAGFSHDNYYKLINRDDGSRNFDFVIVGGGSAGCVLANRMSENPNWKVGS